ncbi:MAG: T9SS type A sorting domain-containing protein [Sphingobacteriaceae bacterium]|nr:T9SS type A sorting domain-containing protein [Sphingobacteriaceae bacterium]
MEPQVSRTADGTKVFYTWVNNSTYTLGAANQSPNLFSRAFDVTVNKWTNVKDFTSCNGAMNGLVLFPHLASEILEPVAGTFKLASVYGALSVANDPSSTSNFRFIDNATFLSTEFTINQPTVAVTINQGNSWLLCPSNNLTLSITGAYSQVLWNNATITNSTTVNTPSLYIVTVKNACAFGADSITVTGLVSTPVANSASICIGNSSTLSVTGNAFSYTWQPSNVTTTSTIVSPTTTSIYTLNATGTGPCVDSKTLQVTVNPLPTITVNNPTACTNSNLMFTASGGTVVNWVGPNAFFVTVQNPTIVNVQPLHSGCYTVTGASACGGTNTAMSCGTVFPLPGLTVSGTPTVMCAGNSATFNVSGATTYSWNSGPTTSAIVVSPSLTTSYTVIGTDVNTCTSSAVSSISVNPLPIVSINGPSIICIGALANITASGANTYTWNTSATTSSISVSPTTTTTYTVNGTSAAGCTNSATYAQNVSTCSGLAEINDTKGISIYPNPNNGEFMIVSGADINLVIVNNLGDVVSTINLSATSEQKINLNNLPEGVYFIIGKNDLGLVRQKILISK